MNTVNVIVPYRWAGTWVFDDSTVGLNKEPFVFGIPEMIETLLEKKGMSQVDRFRLTFSEFEFPDYDEKLDLQSGQVDQGSFYESTTFGKVGWLCPALSRYFDKTPARIYVKFDLV
jgi:hypothetical protein